MSNWNRWLVVFVNTAGIKVNLVEEDDLNLVVPINQEIYLKESYPINRLSRGLKELIGATLFPERR